MLRNLAELPRLVGWFGALRRLFANDAGNIAMLTGLMSTVVIGTASLSVDVGSWYATRRAMQSAADAAAIGGMNEMLWGHSNSQISTAALADAATNGFTNANGTNVTVTIGTSPRSVTVAISRPADLYLSRVLLTSAPTLSATARAAVASNTGGTPLCLLALHPTADATLTTPGNGALRAPTCGLVADSTSTNAISVRTGTMIGSTICGPGGYTVGNGTVSPTPTHCPAIDDPLANLAPPANANAPCQFTNYSANHDATLSPGVYCGGIGVNGNATITLQPGVYILRNGGLTAQGTAVINGAGVGFYLTGSGTAVQLSKDDITLTGNITVNLSAPTSGPLAGIIFYQAKDAPTGDITHTITGNDKTNFTGTLYFGNQNVVFTGNGTVNGTAPFMAVIANTVTVTGSAIVKLGTNFAGSSVPALGLMLPRAALTM